MQLEDHLGDILSKARAGTGLGVAEAAAAAGMTNEAYEQLEQTGQVLALPDYGKLGKALELDPGKLRGIAGGWLPKARTLEAWRHLSKITTERGMAVNAYLIGDEEVGEAALFDTGWEVGPVFELMREKNLRLRFLCITHSHADHIAGLDDLRRKVPDATIVHGGDTVAVGRRLRPGEVFSVGRLRVAWRPTPGHADDGVTYVVSGWPGGVPNLAVVGDAIFAGSMGGARAKLGLARERVRDAILSLDESTLICAGHGPPTTVGEERAHNPFFP